MSRPSGQILRPGTTPKSAMTLAFRNEIDAKLAYGTLSFFTNDFDTNANGFYLTDPTRGGLFRYDPSDTESTQDISLVLVKNDKRYKRVIIDEINVRWWDVKGDGVTDDTVEFMKAVTFWANNGGNLLIPYGTYFVNMPTEYPNPTGITVPFNIKNLTITGSNATLKTRKGIPAVGQQLRNDFSAFKLHGHLGCDIKVTGVNVVGSRDTETDDYDYVPNNIYVDWSARTANNCFGLHFKDFGNVFIDKCSVKKLHGRGIFLSGGNFAQVTNCVLDDISRSGIEASVGNLKMLIVSNCNITNIGVFKDTFVVSGVTYSFLNDPSGRVWYSDVGDGVYFLGSTMQVTNNYFKNINRIAIVTDLAGLDSTIKGYLVASHNVIEYDNLNMRCSNPFAGIWIEKTHSGNIVNNTLRFYNRAPSEDVPGYGIVCAVSNTLNCDFNVESNKIYSEFYNKGTYLTGINTINNNGSVVIKNNTAFGRFFTCAYHTNATKGTSPRQLEKLVYDSNTFTNISEANGATCVTYDSSASDGGGAAWIKRYYFINNILSCVNKGRSNAAPYATELNVIKGNDLDGTPVDLRSLMYPDNCFFLEDNKNVGALVPKNGVSGAENFLYIRRNQFLGEMMVGAPSGLTRTSGEIKDNVVNGRIFIRSYHTLNIDGNTLKGDGIWFNNNAQSSFKVNIINNFILLNSDKIGVFFNNGNNLTYQNVTIMTNIFDTIGAAINTTAIKFQTGGTPPNRLYIGENTYNFITTKEVNTGHNPTIKTIIPFNIPEIAAGGTYLSIGSNIPGARLGQYVQAAMDIDLGGLDPIQGYVSAPDTVYFVVKNSTNAAIDLGAGNVHVTII